MQATPKSPGLEAHQNALKIIYSWTTPEQFDTAPALLKQKQFEILKPTQIATLLGVVENQRKLYASKSTPITVAEVTRPQEIAEEYKEIDEEQFGAEEVVISTPSVEQEVGTEPDPVQQVEIEPKTRKTRTPKVGGLTPMPVPTQGVQSVTVSRRVNLPIEGVQYSNNEFNVSVTASNREGAVNELNTLTEAFLADQGLVRKSIADKTIADLRAQLKAEQEKKVTPPVQPVDTELAKKHEKLRDMMNFIYKNSTNKEEFVALKNQFTSLPN